MNEQEIQKVLDELHEVRPEKLNEKGKRLFNAIMSIADERDLYKRKLDKAIEYIESNSTNYYVEKPNYRGVELINIEDLLKILKGE